MVLGAFHKIAKSDCLSVRMLQRGSHWKDFHEIWNFSIFQKSAGKIQVSVQSEINNGCFTCRPESGRSRVRFPIVSLEFFIDIILPVPLWPWGRLSL